jgi:hypothetical protein
MLGPRNRGRSWNVLPVDTAVRLYLELSGRRVEKVSENCRMKAVALSTAQLAFERQLN